MFQFECRLLYHCFQQELNVMNFLVWERPCWQQKLDYLLACRYSSCHLRDVFLPVRHNGCRDDAKLRCVSLQAGVADLDAPNLC